MLASWNGRANSPDTDFAMRPARHSDIEAIAAFTTGTFEWGDYVSESILEWMSDPSGVVMVATDDTDNAISVGRCILLTPREAWLHAARVSPEHRGKGIAGDMAVVLTDWAREHGALVARLLIEESNTSSIRHIEKTAFRRTTTVHRGSRSLAGSEPSLNGNGGSRRRSQLVAREGTRVDAQMVTASWTSGEAGRALRGLIGKSWSFYRLRSEDVEAAAKQGMLWEIGGSWAISQESDGMFEVLMVDASPSDADDFVRALVDVAVDREAENFRIWVADQSWLVTALTTAGCQIDPSRIYELAL